MNYDFDNSKWSCPKYPRNGLGTKPKKWQFSWVSQGDGWWVIGISRRDRYTYNPPHFPQNSKNGEAMQLGLEFPQTAEPVGFKFLYDGQMYEIIDARSEMRVLEWCTYCAECNALFILKTGYKLTPSSAFNRRCRQHRKAGVPVRAPKRRGRSARTA